MDKGSTLFVKLPPQQENHCTASCKFQGSDKGEMIRCSLCWRWFHLTCVDLKTSESDFSYWPCPCCRQTSQKVQNLEAIVTSLVSTNKLLMEKLATQATTLDAILSQETANTDQLEEQGRKLTELNTRLTEASKHPKAVNRRHTSGHLDGSRFTYADAMTAGATEPSSEEKAFLIGNSLVRKASLVKTAAGIPVETRSKSGATYNDLSKELDDVAKNTPSIKEIHIVGGTRDIDSSDTPIDSIIEECTALVAKAKNLAKDVTLSSVLPRTDRNVAERGQKINRALVDICQKANATFVNHDKNFMYQDGSADESAFHNDGVHLNDRGLKRLLQNIGLTTTARTRDEAHSARQSYGRDVRHNTTIRYRNNAGNSNHGRQIRCYFCAEPGHTKDSCRHGKPVVCSNCHNSGHKAKFCGRA